MQYSNPKYNTIQSWFYRFGHTSAPRPWVRIRRPGGKSKDLIIIFQVGSSLQYWPRASWSVEWRGRRSVKEFICHIMTRWDWLSEWTMHNKTYKSWKVGGSTSSTTQNLPNHKKKVMASNLACGEDFPTLLYSFLDNKQIMLVFLKQPNEMLSLILYHQIRSCLQIKLNQLSTEIEM